MPLISITSLFTVETFAKFLDMGLGIAKVVGLPVTSWSAGDPTRTVFKFVAEAFSTLEGPKATYIKAGFLSSARADAEESGDSSWLKVNAWEVYGYESPEATYAAPTVTFTNAGGGLFDNDPGDVTVRCSATGKTYHNTAPFLISPGPGFTTVAIAFVADEAGADSTVSANEIDEIVTTMNGVEIVSSTAAVANDEQTPAEIEEQARATLGALSPNGPDDAYEYVVRNPALTGVTDITRAKADADSDTGDVAVYIAGSGGAVAASSVTAAQDAVERWATPLTITPTVINATEVTKDVNAQISADDLPSGWEADVEDALVAYFAALPIGGMVALSAIITVIQNTLVALGARNVVTTLLTPAANEQLDPFEVATPGTITLTEV
jgi:uncharacterized phage protein gp47/JayE